MIDKCKCGNIADVSVYNYYREVVGYMCGVCYGELLKSAIKESGIEFAKRYGRRKLLRRRNNMAELKIVTNLHFNTQPFEAGMRDAAKTMLKFVRMLRKQRMKSKPAKK